MSDMNSTNQNTIVKIVGRHAKNRAADWCIENLGGAGLWDFSVVSPVQWRDIDEPIYHFLFEKESDAVWFALAHGELIQ